MSRLYARPEENTAYMQGYVAGGQATGLDWAKLRLAVDDAKKAVELRCQAYEDEIKRLHLEIEDRECRLIERESEIEALKLAWRHRRDERG